MNIIELTVDEVIGFNRKAIEKQRQKDPNCQEQHRVIRKNDLEGAIRSVFYQSQNGYVNLPIEKMAGLLLHKIAQRQAFENGNKRTAVIAVFAFLKNHGLQPRLKVDEAMSLINGFAVQPGATQPEKTEEDAIQYIFDNVMPSF